MAGGTASPATDQLGEAVPLIGSLLGMPSSDRYPALEPQPPAAEAAHARTPDRAARRVSPATARCSSCMRTCTGSTRPRWSCSTCPSSASRPAGAGCAHLPARVQSAVVGLIRTSASLPLNRLGRREGAAMVERISGGKALPDEIAGPDRGAHRRRAAVRRRADQDGARVGPARRCRRPLRARRPAAALGHARRPCTDFAAGPPRPPRPGEGGRPDRAAVIGREFSHDLLAAVSPPARSQSRRRPRPARRFRADLSAAAPPPPSPTASSTP